MALSGALVSVLVAGDAAAGVELASTFVLRGRRGTWRQALAFCVAGVTWRSLFVTQLLDTPRPPLSPAARLSHTHTTQLCHTPSFTHNFVNHHLSHTLFHTQLSHTTFSPHTHTSSFFVTHQLSYATLSPQPPPPPLSFLPSPSPLQHLVLMIGRS